MKILVASSYKHAWNSVRPEAELFIELQNRGHSITILTQKNIEYKSKFEAAGIKVIECYPSKKICIKTIKIYRKELISDNYDIFYAFNSKTIPNAAFASIGTKVKLITYRGTTGGLYRHDPSAYLTHLHPRIDGIICVSKAVEKDVKKRVWKNKSNIVTIYKGQSTSWYTQPPANREDFVADKNAILGICAAHVRPSKGIPILLEAMKLLNCSSFHLILVGSGFEPYLEKLEGSSVKKNIHFLGHRDDVPSLMAMADIQIQPSISGEGLPRTIIEAMANATTSIVTTTGGSPELVDNERTGYIVPVNNSHEISDAIEKFINNPLLIKEFGKRAKHKLENEFSSSITADKHVDFFDKLVSKGSKPC
ncbi:glycosyltransferase family 4 protein [Vibrio breoganii]|uniref:glycosyltransferase family 4 protein n=1 Tax=Vibrio breoganii TaxID=553239 RepID=UPI000C84E12B|nr:glycosyltransferase family 4 protein [Vibrio breoganii]PML60351.1 glycosyl transferase family 1 [Vibrio breoganii]PMO82025.1 glycosyl transferase family 1 [Vibrio breoganii]